MVSKSEFDWSSDVGKRARQILETMWRDGKTQRQIAMFLTKQLHIKFTVYQVGNAARRFGCDGRPSPIIVGIKPQQPSEQERKEALEEIMRNLVKL